MSQSSQTAEGIKRETYWSLMLASLRYRDFRFVWLGSFTEHFGEFMEIAAVLWLANELSHSPLILTIVGSARFMSMIFFPIVGGVVADRVDRRRLLIVALMTSALLSSLLAILASTGAIAVWHLIVFGLLSGVAMSFNHPARQTIVPNLIRKEHLLNAVSLDFISVYASRMVSAALVGYVIAAFGVWPAFVIRASGCLLAIFWLILARIPPTPPATRSQAPWQNLVAGFRYLKANTLIFALTLLYLIPWLSDSTRTNFVPIFAEDILHIGAVGYGYLQSAPGLGAILALIGLTLLTYYRRKTLLLIGAGAIMGAGIIGFSASTSVSLSLTLLVIVTAMQTAMITLITTTAQAVIPDDMRGRVMSWREVTFGLGPTGSIVFGAIAQYTGAPVSLGLLGVISLVTSLSLIGMLPKLRRLD